MKKIRFEKLVKNCAVLSTKDLPIQDTIQCYLAEFVADLDLSGMMIVDGMDLYLVGDKTLSSIVEKERNYLKRNREVEYKKTTNHPSVDYLISIGECFFAVLRAKEENDSFFLDDMLMAFVRTLFHHTRQLSISNERRFLLEKILKEIPEYLAFKDLSGVYRYSSKLTDQMYQDRFDTVVGKSIDEVYPADEAKVVRSLDDEVIQAKKNVSREIEVLTDEGYRSVESIRTPIMKDDGEVIGVMSLGHDVSPVRVARDMIQKNVDFQAVLMSIATKFINQSPSETKASINEALAIAGNYVSADRVYVFTYDFENNRMDNTHEWCHEGISPEIDNLQNVPISEFRDIWVDHHVRGQNVYVEDVSKLDHESSLYAILEMQNIQSLLTIPMIYQNHTLGFVGFDAVRQVHPWSEQEQNLLKVLTELITNLILKEKNQKQLELAIKQAELSSNAKTDFLANMSHEIRTPLSGMYNAIYLLTNSRLSEEQKSALDVLNSSIESLSGIVDNVLDLSKIESGKVEIYQERIDLEETLFQLYMMQESIAREKGIEIRFAYDLSLPRHFMIDKVRIRQIMLNLLNNAIKYTENGSVTMSIERADDENGEIGVAFRVLDTGIGIAQEHISRLTEQFFQIDSSVSKKYAGTGLGLPIASNLIELMGGKLQVTSVVGEGSNFSFVLKLTATEPPLRRNLPKIIGRKMAVLRGDSKTQHEVLTLFTSLGFDVKIINSQKDYTNLPDKNSFDDIVFLDRFSDLSEERVYTWHRLLGRDDTKLIVCRFDAGVDAQSFYEMGFDHVISLPTTRKRILDAYEKKDVNELPVSLETESSSDKKLRVLIVEDNRMNRRVLASILEKLGYVIREADNGLNAVDLVKEETFDLILMDLQMPVMNGLEATKAIRSLGQRYQAIPIIALTAYALQETKEEAITAGMNDVITKPFVVPTLIEILKRYLPDRDATNETIKKLTIPTSIPMFDEVQFKQTFFGSEDLENEVFRTFLSEVFHDMNEIRTAVLNKDTMMIERSVHYFKGSVSYLAASRLLFITQTMMSMNKSHDYLGLSGAFASLESEVDLFIQFLKQRLSERK